MRETRKLPKMSSELGIGTKAGIIGGTLLSIFGKVNFDDLVSTAILAGVGAVVSFFVSMTLKWTFTYFRKKGKT